jgi:hypothetical protein
MFRLVDRAASDLWEDEPVVGRFPTGRNARKTNRANAYRSFFSAAGYSLCREISRFGGLHFSLLYYASRVTSLLMRLLETNVGLAFALVAQASRLRVRGGRDLEFLEGLLGKKEREIATELGFPHGTWRILKRVCPAALTVGRCERFRHSLRHPTRARIGRHLERLGASVLEIFAEVDPDGFDRIENAFLHELAEAEPPETHRPRIASRLLALLAAHRRWFSDTPLHLKTLSQLDQLCERYLAFIDPKQINRLRGLRLPPPPVPEDDCIRAIQTGDELARESALQQNCVATMLGSVMLGESYLYRVEPRFGFERCTVELVREEDDEQTVYRMGEVRTRNNGTPKRSTIDAIGVWLADRQHLPDARVLPRYHPMAVDHGGGDEPAEHPDVVVF